MLQRSATAVLILIFFIVIPAISISQERKSTSPQTRDPKIQSVDSADLSLDELKAERAAVEGVADLEESIKKTVLSILDQAIGSRESEALLSKKIEEIVQRVKGAPQRIREIEAELDRPPPGLEPFEQKALTMERSQLALQIQNIEADLGAARSNLNGWIEYLKEQSNQQKQRQQNIESAQKKIAEIEKELLAAPAPDQLPLIVEARRAAQHAEKNKWQAEIRLYTQQLASQDVLVSLSIAERDLAVREVARLESISKIYTAQAQRLRELEAEKVLVEAQMAKNLAVGLPPDIQNQFDINIKLSKMLAEITAKDAKISAELQLKQTRLQQLEEEFTLAHEQVKYPIHNEILGLALLELSRTLPSIQDYRRKSAERRVLMGEIRADQIIVDRQRLELADLDQAIQNILKSIESLSQPESENMENELRQLLSDRRDLLRKLQERYRRVFRDIQRLEFIGQAIAARAEQEALFLNEHLLWIRSAKRIGVSDLQNLSKALQWIFAAHHWRQVVQSLGLAFMDNTVLWIPGLLIAFTAMGLRRWAHRELSRIARDVYSVKTDSFVLTLRALALAGRVVLGWPLLLGLTGWQLANVPLDQDFPQAVGKGLMFAVQTLLGGLLVYELCWKRGVAKVHFKWPESVRRTLRRSLQWFIPLAFVMTFIIAAVQARNDAASTDSLGRLALITFMAGFSVWAAYMLRFSGEIVTMLKRRRARGWLVRTRVIWYLLAVGVPLVLALLAAMGYYHSAYALYLRMGETIALILILIIVKDLVLRWLFISRRRLDFEEAERKKEAQDEMQEKEQTADAGHEGVAAVVEELEINVDQIYEKNRVLLRTIMFFSALIGLWVIWDNVLPALNFLNNVQLWTYSSEVEGVTKTFPITLANLMIAIIVAIITIVSARTLPGVLEFILLKQLSMNPGSRHAFSKICSYAITALGVIIAFTTIGFKWSSIHWLVAALGVGLGFGLQEIVANFICGLIVLFERPFGIGDTVTIGDISGTVSRIRIRATTIMDWDRKELIVPNKEFITGRLVNWSHSDPIIRIKVPVGIAYGSDTDLAEKLLLKTARANPMILDTPKPQAVFLGFGDNSLNFELRVFINGIDDWIPMLHQLNRTIDREFRNAGVTISFPQRDVHLDASGPLEVKVVSGSPNSTSSTPQPDSHK